MMSMLFACAIALNLQLVMVFKRQPSSSSQKYFIGVPVALSLIMTLPPLFLGWFGFDETRQYCWYSSNEISGGTLLLRVLFTYNLWCLVACLYLVIASVTVIVALSLRASRISHLTGAMDGQMTTKTSDSDRKNAARRALTIRLLGFITIPIVCVVPTIIAQFVIKQGASPPDALGTLVTGIQGLMGAFNAMFVASDPAVLAIYYAYKAAREKRYRMRRGIPLTLSPAREGESSEQSDDDHQRKYVELGQAPKKVPFGIIIKVEVTRETDLIRDTESDLYGM
jgi:hypothetical protein